MIIFIKYPLLPYGIESYKHEKWCILGNMEKKIRYTIVYPLLKFTDKNEVIYPKENKMKFFSKSINHSDILMFKGGFGIEKCNKSERITIARKWYFETNQNMPRKMKKNLIGTFK